MVARVIWADMLSIAVTYFITLCLFPGLESEIRHCILGEWLPILLMAVFNLSDFVGKVGPTLGEGRMPPVEDARGSGWGGWELSHGSDHSQGQEEGHVAPAPGSLVGGGVSGSTGVETRKGIRSTQNRLASWAFLEEHRLREGESSVWGHTAGRSEKLRARLS